jgi:hypothetical protein
MVSEARRSFDQSDAIKLTRSLNSSRHASACSLSFSSRALITQSGAVSGGFRACSQTSSHLRRTAWLALSSAGVPSNTIRP